MLGLRNGSSDELFLRLAKAVTTGKFDGAGFGRKPFSELFPTQSACPHCRGRGRRRVWKIGEADRMLADIGKLAQEIKRKQLCRSCLSQLGEVAETKGKLKELGKGDPRSLSIRSSGAMRTFLLLVAASIIVALLSSLPGIFLLLLRLMVELPTIMFRF